MRIALTHNVQTSHDEAQAEFDTPETIAALVAALERLGHEVVPVDVGVPLPALTARLMEVGPDLVFNTAEGTSGPAREALYPALFEQLGLPYTGSDPHACVVTLDKHLTRLVVAAAGVPVAPAALVMRAGEALPEHVGVPCILKPNFEGSSKGITEASVVRDAADYPARLAEMLARYPEGVLVEGFVPGRDVVVPYIAGVRPSTGDVLDAVEYDVARERGASAIYDYTLKHEDSQAVSVRCPAQLDPALAARIEALSRRAFEACRVRDIGRIDYRVTPDGEPVFLEVNALPSLEPGAGVYAAAEQAGKGQIEDVLGAVIASACRRHGLDPAPAAASKGGAGARRRASGLRVGLVYNLKRVASNAETGQDAEAEFDTPETVGAITEALRGLGHEVVPLEADATLLRRVEDAKIDAAFNIAEGLRGRGREALVPAVLDLLNIQYTGSDAATMALTLDKALAKRVVAHAGVNTPRFALLDKAGAKLDKALTFPLIVKPVAEGSSKGVSAASVVRDRAALDAAVEQLTARYQQPALVEAFLPGREFTVGILGGAGRPRVLPPMEICFTDPDDPTPVYALAYKLNFDKAVRYDAPAAVTPELGQAIERTARAAFRALGCRDVARVDLRLDADGAVHFIECNPLPGLTPGWSDLCLIAKSAGLEYSDLIRAILAPALRRRDAQLRSQAV